MPFRLLAILAVVAGCSESPTESLPDENSFTFAYRLGNDPSRGFSAHGRQPDLTPFATPGPWVYTASAGAPHTTVIVRAWQQTAAGWMDFLVYVPNVSQIDSVFLGSETAGTCPGPNSPCTQSYFRTHSAAGAVTETCVIVNGMMYITRRTPQWVSGTFSGTGTCGAAGGAQRAFQVQDGAFGVELPPPTAAPG